MDSQVEDPFRTIRKDPPAHAGNFLITCKVKCRYQKFLVVLKSIFNLVLKNVLHGTSKYDSIY